MSPDQLRQVNFLPEETQLNNNECSPSSRDTSGAFEKLWFCAAVCKDGSFYMVDAETPASFLETLDNSLIAWVDYRTPQFKEDMPAGSDMLGFSKDLIDTLSGNTRLFYEDRETELGIKIPSIQIRMEDGHIDVQQHTTLLLLKRNFILTVHPILVDRRFTRLRQYSKNILQKIPLDISAEDKLTTLLIRIIDQNNDRNFEHLRQIEARGDDLNKNMVDTNIQRSTLGPQIYDMKHALITYLDALWETVDVIHDLRYGDADLLTNEPQLLERVGLLAGDVGRQIGLAEHLSEVLASGLEVMQSIYNNQLQLMNNRMSLLIAYLTVLGTAVMVPNTLATIMGSSAFNLQVEDQGWYLTLIIISTIVATALAFLWVKKSGFIPQKMD